MKRKARDLFDDGDLEGDLADHIASEFRQQHGDPTRGLRLAELIEDAAFERANGERHAADLPALVDVGDVYRAARADRRLRGQAFAAVADLCVTLRNAPLVEGRLNSMIVASLISALHRVHPDRIAGAPARAARVAGGKARAETKRGKHGEILADRARLLSQGHAEHEIAGILEKKHRLDASNIRRIFKKAGVS